MRIWRLKSTSLFVMLALLALFFGAAEAQEIPPPPTAQATDNTADGVTQPRVETAPPRKEGLVIPEIVPLVGPVVVRGTENDQATITYVSLVGIAPGSGYGEITTRPISMARLFFSETPRGAGSVLTFRIGGIFLRLPLTVQAVFGGFMITNKEAGVKVINLVTEHEYEIGEVIPYLGTTPQTVIVDVEFPSAVSGLQVVFDKPDGKSWTAVNFTRVRLAPPAPPGRP